MGVFDRIGAGLRRLAGEVYRRVVPVVPIRVPGDRDDDEIVPQKRRDDKRDKESGGEGLSISAYYRGQAPLELRRYDLEEIPPREDRDARAAFAARVAADIKRAAVGAQKVWLYTEGPKGVLGSSWLNPAEFAIDEIADWVEAHLDDYDDEVGSPLVGVTR